MSNLNFQDVIRDVHNPTTHTLQTSSGGATIFAVVNTGAVGGGQVTVTLNNTPTVYAVVNTAAVGITNSIVTINPRTDYIGLMSVSGNVAVSALPATPVGTNFIGLVTVAPHSLTASTLNIGSVSVLGGGIGLNAGINGIGFATVKVDVGTRFIGLVTAFNSNQQPLVASSAYIGLATTINASSTANIGSVSVLGGGVGLNAGVNSIGFATVTLSPNGNPSVFAVNVGTNKTLVNLPIAFSTASTVTVAVPTNANTIKIANMLLNSDATVRFTMKSGVTYLTGNASIGITLNPAGGFIMTGSPDSPSWIGLPSGALVIEKLDLTPTAAKIAGNVVYWQE